MGDNVGYVVAVSGFTAVVGVPKDDVGTGVQLIDQGSAYVFVLDGLAPTTTATVAPAANAAGWNHTPVTVTLSAGDAGSGVDKTYDRLGDSGLFARYSDTAKPVVSANGVSGFKYFSTDLAGNAETPARLTLRIDTVRPTGIASRNVTATSGRMATLPFRIRDPIPSCGQAKVKLTIKPSGVVVQTVRFAHVPTNTARSYSFRVTLKKGTYTWRVTAPDIARHIGGVSVSKQRTVK